MARDPTFTIPARPERRYPRSGGVEYVGETIFRLGPDEDQSDQHLQSLVETVLESDRYTYGDWFDLPMPLYLVHDHRTGDVFRVTIRSGRIELHVLPATESDGLRAFYDLLDECAEIDWGVTCETSSD